MLSLQLYLRALKIKKLIQFIPSFQDNSNTLSKHIGPTSLTASHSNTNKEFILSKRDPALEVSALKFDNSTLSESAPDDSDPGDWVPNNAVRQVSENEE